jgi:hypothetical protein
MTDPLAYGEVVRHGCAPNLDVAEGPRSLGVGRLHFLTR